MKNLSPVDVHQLHSEGKICLIDVREAHEHASERIPGAILCSLSCFDPANLPDAGGKPVVFHCAGGVRSARAVEACLNAGLPHDSHMAGGLAAWRMHGLPTDKS